MDDQTQQNINEYRNAFLHAWFKDAPEITYCRGWFRMLGKSYRRGEIIEMTRHLRAMKMLQK